MLARILINVTYIIIFIQNYMMILTIIYNASNKYEFHSLEYVSV